MSSNEPLDTNLSERARLERLAAYEAILTAPDFTIGRWVASETGPNGVIHLGYFEYSETALRFVEDLDALGWVYVFDWMTWTGTPQGKRLLGGTAAVASASAADLAKLLTTIVRGDRFSDGEIAGAFEAGMLTAIAHRAGELAAEL